MNQDQILVADFKKSAPKQPRLQKVKGERGFYRDTTTGHFVRRLKNIDCGVKPGEGPIVKNTLRVVPGRNLSAARDNWARELYKYKIWRRAPDQFANPFAKPIIQEKDQSFSQWARRAPAKEALLAWSVEAQKRALADLKPIEELCVALRRQLDQSPSVAELGQDWQTFKEGDTTLAPKSLTEIRFYARWIRQTFGQLKPSEFDRQHIEPILRQLKVSNNTRRKYLRFLCMFARWLKHERIIAADPFDAISFKGEKFQAAFYTVNELKTLLRFVHDFYPDLIGYYALLAFAGLRPTEGARVQWEDLDFESGQLYVRPGKTGDRRIDLQPVALQWLSVHRSAIVSGPFISLQNLENREKQIRGAALKREWIQDGLRHGFATFYYAKIQDLAKVATYMGNSGDIVKRHYARTIPRAERDRFWRLDPFEVLSQLELNL